MKLFKVLGSVTLGACHPSFRGARLLATEQIGNALLTGTEPEESDLVVVWDDHGAGVGAMIAVSDGAEAAQPFRPNLKPVDAYCTAILDSIHIDSEVVKQLKH